ncbi:MAG: hypothetical protein WC533_04210 [Candidatus Pacearchaeota archaeon]
MSAVRKLKKEFTLDSFCDDIARDFLTCAKNCQDNKLSHRRPDREYAGILLYNSPTNLLQEIRSQILQRIQIKAGDSYCVNLMPDNLDESRLSRFRESGFYPINVGYFTDNKLISGIPY